MKTDDEKRRPTAGKDTVDSSRRNMLRTTAAGVAAFSMASFGIRPSAAAKKPIRIGFPAPLTGPYGSEAREQARCAQIAVDQFNKAGGLGGRMAELLVRDAKLNPGEAATRTLELIEEDKVDFVCGGLSASVQLSINEVAKARKKIFVSISQSDTINEAADFSRYTFHEALNPHMTSGAVGRYVFPKHGKRVALLVSDYAYGHEMARGFKRAGEEFGIEVVAEVLHPLGTQDYSTFLPRLQAARPDVLLICNFGRDQLNSIKQANSFGLKNNMQLVAPVLLYNQRVAGGADVFEGVLGGANYYWELEKTLASAKAFNDRYRAKFDGRPPVDYGAYGYAGVSSLLRAVKEADTTDTDAVIAAMERMRYDTHKGAQYYRECDHQSVQSVLVIASKPAAAMSNEHDVFDIEHVEAPSEDNLRSCQELGHVA